MTRLSNSSRSWRASPQHVEARVNSGLAQAALGFPELALAEFDQAPCSAPAHPIVHYNRGVALLALGRYAEALAANDSALAAMPEHPGAWIIAAARLSQLNRLDEAIASYGKAIARNKDNADAHFNTALALLTRGDYRAGFAEYEWRWRRTGMPAQKSRGRPLWLGDYPLARKTILLHAEQGLGDTIQFARYVPLLAASGAKIVLEVQAELKSLMTSLDGAATVIARGEAPPSFDVHCPLGSLPLALHTEPATVPAPIPYLARRRSASRQMVGSTRRSSRSRASPSPGPAMPATTTIATARSLSRALRRSSRCRQASSASSATCAAKTQPRSPVSAVSRISAASLTISAIPLQCWRCAIW